MLANGHSSQEHIECIKIRAHGAAHVNACLHSWLVDISLLSLMADTTLGLWPLSWLWDQAVDIARWLAHPEIAV